MMMGITEAAQDISFPAMAKHQDRMREDCVGRSCGGNGHLLCRLTAAPREQRPHVYPAQAPGASVWSADVVIARLSKQGGASRRYQSLPASYPGRPGRRALSQGAVSISLQSADLNELNRWAPNILGGTQPHPGTEATSTATSKPAACNPRLSLTATPPPAWGSLTMAIDNTLYDRLWSTAGLYHLQLQPVPCRSGTRSSLLLDPSSLNQIYVRFHHGFRFPSARGHFERTNTSSPSIIRDSSPPDRVI